jgi:Cleft lip and palate transmembrane protein 1 (CLPTM1)
MAVLDDNMPAFVSADRARAAYIPPRLSASIVADWTVWPFNAIPDHIAAALKVDRSKYLPLLSAVQMGVKRNELIQINETGKNDYPPIQVEIGQIGLSRWAFYAIMDESFSVHRKLGIMEESDMDDIRGLLTENPAELLALTMVISMFHLLFDALAFKSDITYWREMGSAQGLSVRSIGLGLFGQLIVAMYLREQEASALILLPSYVGLFIGGWKFAKLLHLRKSSSEGMSAFAGDGIKSDHDAADSTAFRYMSLILTPLVCGYAFLTLVRDDHYSWYSWAISSLATSVYAGGFALMTPQVFLNYRLKSVAHLDWTALCYRAFNTFIDDFFAYLIPMPGLARMAVLRDDFIFLIFLYQRWIYPSRKEKND